MIIIPATPIHFFIVRTNMNFSLIFYIIPLCPSRGTKNQPGRIQYTHILHRLNFQCQLFRSSISRFIHHIVDNQTGMTAIPLYHTDDLFMQNSIHKRLSHIQTEAARLFKIEQSQLISIIHYVSITDKTMKIQHIQP